MDRVCKIIMRTAATGREYSLITRAKNPADLGRVADDIDSHTRLSMSAVLVWPLSDGGEITVKRRYLNGISQRTEEPCGYGRTA